MLSGCQGGHIERTANAGASAPDGTLASVLAAVAVVRRQADESRDLLAIELAEFREIGQQRGAGHRADARCTLQEFVFVLPVIVVADAFGQFRIELLNLFRQRLKNLVNALECELGPCGALAVFLHRLQLDQLPAAGDQILDFLLIFRGRREEPRPNLFPKLSQDGGIQAVGLGQATRGSGEVTHLSRVGHRHGETSGLEFGRESSLIATGRFEDNKTNSERSELLDELVNASRIIGEFEAQVMMPRRDVEGILGDVDADELIPNCFDS